MSQQEERGVRSTAVLVVCRLLSTFVEPLPHRSRTLRQGSDTILFSKKKLGTMTMKNLSTTAVPSRMPLLVVMVLCCLMMMMMIGGTHAEDRPISPRILMRERPFPSGIKIDRFSTSWPSSASVMADMLEGATAREMLEKQRQKGGKSFNKKQYEKEVKEANRLVNSGNTSLGKAVQKAPRFRKQKEESKPVAWTTGVMYVLFVCLFSAAYQKESNAMVMIIGLFPYTFPLFLFIIQWLVGSRPWTRTSFESRGGDSGHYESGRPGHCGAGGTTPSHGTRSPQGLATTTWCHHSGTYLVSVHSGFRQLCFWIDFHSCVFTCAHS